MDVQPGFYGRLRNADEYSSEAAYRPQTSRVRGEMEEVIVKFEAQCPVLPSRDILHG